MHVWRGNNHSSLWLCLRVRFCKNDRSAALEKRCVSIGSSAVAVLLALIIILFPWT